jgi:rhomboid protease GluP
LARDGAAAASREALRELARTTARRDLAQAIHLRLQAPPAAATGLDQQANERLDEVQRIIDATPGMTAPARRFGLLRARATQFLILLNVAAFGAELWRGDTTDGDMLYALGALWPQAVVQGHEWWRLGTAMFLHAGVAHIAVNMLSLAGLGPAIEQRYGWKRFLLIYFAAGLGSMAAIVGFVQWGWVDGDLFLGASGAIMGLFGAFVVVVVQMGKGAPRRHFRGQICAVLALVILQMGFDLSHPEVSLAAHEGGLFIGVAIALVLAAIARRRGRTNRKVRIA